MYFVLKRRPLFYVMNLILPTGVITTVAMVGLFAPTHANGQRREKMEMGLNSLLALSMMIMNLSELMPRSGKVVPLLSEFLRGFSLL